MAYAAPPFTMTPAKEYRLLDGLLSIWPVIPSDIQLVPLIEARKAFIRLLIPLARASCQIFETWTQLHSVLTQIANTAYEIHHSPPAPSLLDLEALDLNSGSSETWPEPGSHKVVSETFVLQILKIVHQTDFDTLEVGTYGMSSLAALHQKLHWIRKRLKNLWALQEVWARFAAPGSGKDNLLLQLKISAAMLKMRVELDPTYDEDATEEEELEWAVRLAGIKRRIMVGWIIGRNGVRRPVDYSVVFGRDLF